MSRPRRDPTERVAARESRAATDRLLALLRADGPRWERSVRFAFATAVRSAGQVVAHPRAVAELSLLHGLLLAGRRRGGHVRVLLSWGMSVTHLGLLGPRRSIGWATALTLLRANAPALRGVGAWTGVAAVASDRVDGAVARRRGPTQFGHYADSLADAAFWTWFAARHEPDRRLRAAAGVVWAAPVLAVTVASITRGRMVEPVRPARLRPAAAMQGVLAVRALQSARRGHPR